MTFPGALTAGLLIETVCGGTPLARAARVSAPLNGQAPAWTVAIAAFVVSLGAGCVTRDAPVDRDQTVSTSPSPSVTTTTVPPTQTPGTVTVAYTPDLAPIFAADCLRCHSGTRPDGNYSMATYDLVMRKVVVGNARSALVTSTQSRGSMYRYWSGNASAKAELVRSWVVDNAAAQTR